MDTFTQQDKGAAPSDASRTAPLSEAAENGTPLPFPLPARLPPLFDLGRVVATPDALEALRDAATDAWELLHRHQRGDWGDMCVEDRELNRKAVTLGYRLLSCYLLPDTKEKIWIITEADRSATTLLLPSEY